MDEELNEKLKEIETIFKSIEYQEYDLIALDWAGIGDACCHSRLILQHFLPKKILWITTPLVYELYKDDKLMKVVKGFESPLKNPFVPKMQIFTDKINEIFNKIFINKEKIHISYNVSKLCLKHNIEPNFSSFFFEACNVKRDFNIKHKLTHTSEMNFDFKYIAIESGGSSGYFSTDLIKKLCFELNKVDIKVILLGGLNDKAVDGTIDKRGLNLYDTFSILKNCSFFIGKSSGNQSLMCFLQNIPVIEVDVQQNAKYCNCKLHDNLYTIAEQDLINTCLKLINKNKRTCPLCNYNDFNIKNSRCQFSKINLERYECKNCNLVFGTEYMMTLPLNELSKKYKDLYSKYAEGDTTVYEVQTFKNLNPSKEGKYLNFGCGQWSKTIQFLKNEGYNIIGYDPFVGNNNIELLPNSFDGIISHNVIEHWQHPIETMKYLKSLLKQNGKMAHSTECFNYSCEETEYHIFFFIGKSVNLLAEKSGLKFINRIDYNDYSCCIFQNL